MAAAQAIMQTKPPQWQKCHIFEMDGYFLNQGFFKEHLAMVSQTFWDDSAAEHAEGTLRWLLYNSQEGSSVGIHLRFGDEEFMGRNLPLQYYNDALLEVSKRTGEKLTCVIFSDKMEQAMKRSRHFDLCSTRIPMTPGLSDQKTFYMMSMLPNLIIADSTYSFWAEANASESDASQLDGLLWHEHQTAALYDTSLANRHNRLGNSWSHCAMPIFRELASGGAEEPVWEFSFPQSLKMFGLALQRMQMGQHAAPCRARHPGPSIEVARHHRILEKIPMRGQRKLAKAEQRYEKARPGQSRLGHLKETLTNCECRSEGILLKKGADAIIL
ncbi:unnamed protein product [Prorocentrum cordatum]|uniref:Uncharacterized protein n=1 Tax=Prorocentrum cordatum TaxID=2364126 RepID=A0ABN9T4L3_9DINO|nr:unnamed protein product [Polarella glacialis]